jgi:hypothetical protein
MFSRRKFLATSTVALAAVSLPKSLLAERIGGEVFTSGSLGAYTQRMLTQTTFEGLIGTQFNAFLDNSAVAYMRLESVTAGFSAGAPVLKRGMPTVLQIPATTAAQVESFQVTFSTGGANFPQGSYLLDHGTLGRFACFLVPSSPKGGVTCSATFCYLTSAAVQLPGPPAAPVMRPTSRSVSIMSPSFN